MLESDRAVLVVVDVQGKLAQLMHNREELFANLRKIVLGAKVLDVPVVWTEQNPDGLGPTISELSDLIDGEAIPKLAFSCWGEPRFVEALRGTGREQVLIAGIEGHVCMYQTTLDLLAAGYEVHVVADAVSSRAAGNREIGLQRMKEAGAVLTTVEMALFEMLKVAEGPRFKEILRIVK